MDSLLSIEGLLAGIALVISLILFVLVLNLWSKFRGIRNRYERMMSQTGVTNLQEIIIDIQNRLELLNNNGQQNSQSIQAIQERIAAMKGNVSMLRYNAFNEKGQGSDLSFSMAIVDDAKNGAVLTGIFGRDESYMYGKPLELGESKYPLTPEEKEVIKQSTANLTINKKKGIE